MTKIEEVARAICEACGCDWDKVHAAKREATVNCIMHDTFLKAAKAAISAMRKPSDTMALAGEDVFIPSYTGTPVACPEDVFRAMIDAALAEK